MKSINRVTLIGYVEKDPSIFTTAAGKEFVIVRLATNSRSSVKLDKPPNTQWHSVKVRGKESVVYIRKNIIKGSHVMIEGEICYYTKTDGSGINRTYTEIIASHFINLDR